MKDKKEKPKLTFFILTRHAKEPVRDFQQLLEELSHNWGLNIIQSTPTSATISNNMGYSASFELQPSHQFADQGFRLCVKLVINAEDEITLNSIRRSLINTRWVYQIFSEKLQAFLPHDPELVVDELGEYNIEAHRIFSKFGLEPLYYHRKNRVYYAQDVNKEVVIVNRALINFIYEKEIPEEELPEFTYVVAPNVQQFGFLFDRHLVPTNFYEYYQKSHKIINESHFDINNPGRKVFIKPYVMELQEERNEFYTQAGEGSSLLTMDKIRKEETLDQAIKRILSEELKIADDYIGAYVPEEVEFDRNKEGILTPRLIVIIYVDKIKNREWALKMSQTSWRSLNGSLASQPTAPNSRD